MANMTQFDPMQEVDEVKVIARSVDGVLTLPLKVGCPARRIAVN